MTAFFRGVLHCPGCGEDTHIHVKAEAQASHQDQQSGKPLYIPVENAHCEFCDEAFPIYFYEDGIELVIE